MASSTGTRISVQALVETAGDGVQKKVVTFDGAPPPGTINLGIGQPSPDLLPVDLIGKSSELFFADADPLELNYGVVRGDRAFLESLAGLLTEGYGAPGVVVSYTGDPDIQNGKKFAAQGMQIAAGVPLQVGEPCFDAGMHKSCAQGLYCAGEEPGGACAPKRGEGAACERADACESGLRCSEGTCAPRGEPGDACVFDSECGDGLQCHPLDDVCVAVADLGEPCRLPTDYGVEFLSCVEGAWCGEEACEPLLDLGDPCEFSDGCPLGSTCEGGVCTDCSDGACGGPRPLCSAIPSPAMYPLSPE